MHDDLRNAPHLFSRRLQGDGRARFLTILGAALALTFIVPRGANDAGIVMAWDLVAAVGRTWVTTLLPLVSGIALVVLARRQAAPQLLAVALLVVGLLPPAVQALRTLQYDPNLWGLVTCAHGAALAAWFGLAGLALVDGTALSNSRLRAAGLVASAVYLAYLVVPTYGTAFSGYETRAGIAVPLHILRLSSNIGDVLDALLRLDTDLAIVVLVPIGIQLARRRAVWSSALELVWVVVALVVIVSPAMRILRALWGGSIWEVFNHVIYAAQDAARYVAMFAGLVILRPLLAHADGQEEAPTSTKPTDGAPANPPRVVPPRVAPPRVAPPPPRAAIDRVALARGARSTVKIAFAFTLVGAIALAGVYVVSARRYGPAEESETASREPTAARATTAEPLAATIAPPQPATPIPDAPSERDVEGIVERVSQGDVLHLDLRTSAGERMSFIVAADLGDDPGRLVGSTIKARYGNVRMAIPEAGVESVEVVLKAFTVLAGPEGAAAQGEIREAGTRWIIILGGGDTPGAAQAILAAFGGSPLPMFTASTGYPLALRSDTVEGLKAGYEIAVLGTCDDLAVAERVRELVKPQIEGVYLREVPKSGLENCPSIVATPAEGKFFVKVSAAFVRTAPSKDADIVAKLRVGAACSVNSATGEWVNVSCDGGVEGHCKADLLSVDRPTIDAVLKELDNTTVPSARLDIFIRALTLAPSRLDLVADARRAFFDSEFALLADIQANPKRRTPRRLDAACAKVNIDDACLKIALGMRADAVIERRGQVFDAIEMRSGDVKAQEYMGTIDGDTIVVDNEIAYRDPPNAFALIFGEP